MCHDQVEIVNAFIAEEDTDNRRFLADCERWFGREVTILRDEKYEASIDEVWRRERYMVGRYGAPCSRALKQRVLQTFKRPGDVHVLGFTAEESERFEDMRERAPDYTISAPLIDRGLTKSDCLAIVDRAGIVLPRMYRLGFENANCPGCPKGGEGYWNKVRIVFPEVFQARLERQESLGPGAYFFRNRHTGERFGLKDLEPGAGRHDEPAPSCSFFCQLAEQAIDLPLHQEDEKSPVQAGSPGRAHEPPSALTHDPGPLILSARAGCVAAEQGSLGVT